MRPGLTPSAEGLKYWLALAMTDGLIRPTALRLLERFSSPEEIFRAAGQGSASVPPGARRALSGFSGWKRVDREIELIGKSGVEVLVLHDSRYPQGLREIKDPPYVLYARGRVPDFSAVHFVAVEGTRRPSARALKAAREVACGLARRGAVVVSGMAMGCDGAAHRGALEAGGLTVAVLGTGVDVPYPVRNRALYAEIIKRGLALSEQPMGTGPAGSNFLRRNRIISALSEAVVMIEANPRSGSMATARLAFRTGKKVYVLRDCLSPVMEGLVEEGAAVVEDAEEIMARLGRD